MSKRARRVRHARRPRRRDRRRRRALVPARALARHDDRPRPRPRARAESPRTPSTTCSTRTRGSLRSCARRAQARAAHAGDGAGGRAAPVRARADQEAAGLPGRGRRGRRRAARRTGSPPTRSSSRQAFTAFYRDCQVVGRRAEEPSVPPGALRGHAADDRALARPARGRAPGADVGAADGSEIRSRPEPCRAARGPRRSARSARP